MTDVFLDLDLETTGTDSKNDVILEVAWRWLSPAFKPLVGFETPRSYIIDHADWTSALLKLRQAPAVVREMHAESGLLTDLFDNHADRISLPDLESLIASECRDVLNSFGPVRIHLLGMSAHFDQEFLKAADLGYLFKDNERIHHRIADLSAVKLFLEMAGVAYPKATPGNHRALSDIDEAMEQAQLFYALLGRLDIPGAPDAN